MLVSRKPLYAQTLQIVPPKTGLQQKQAQRPGQKHAEIIGIFQLGKHQKDIVHSMRDGSQYRFPEKQHDKTEEDNN